MFSCPSILASANDKKALESRLQRERHSAVGELLSGREEGSTQNSITLSLSFLILEIASGCWEEHGDIFRVDSQGRILYVIVCEVIQRCG